jgi:glutamine amidotransferase
LIAILDYGMGNLRSVARAIEHVGGEADATADRDEIARADALVVPGVGAFGACMRNLRDRGLDEATRAFAASGRPLFGICLGLQVLFESSEEDDEPGLALLAGHVLRLPGGEGVRIPHMGWNEVDWVADHPYTRVLPSGERFYFVHSYAALRDELSVGVARHGMDFAAAVCRDNVFATQFHPEKSGEPGLAIYEAFVKEAAQ